MPPRLHQRLLTEGWEFQCNESWLPAVVPGHVHVDLMRAGVITDPFIGENEKECQWVDERDWSYRCDFDWQPTKGLEYRALRFEGLDTVCSVSLNGEVVAESDNMFVDLEIDVSSSLRAGSNEIRIDFQSAALVGRERKARYLLEQGLADDVPNFDERAFVRKAQYMFGWDWGPRLVSCGIWKPVSLVERSFDWSDQSDPTDLSDRKAISLVQNAEEGGSTFEFYVDGKPFYALGANWIPDHSFPSQVSPERSRQRLQQAKDMGINMLRIWGGGIYETDAFYDICDELGILVWQDFMFACSYYPDSESWQATIRKEAEYQVRRLRHHPCIAIWCGNNECHQVWQDGWGGKDRQPDRFHGEVIYHDILKNVVDRLDPARPYWPGSPYGSGYCNSGADGDQHYWDVWHGRGDWTHYKESDARFSSEFGFASSPSRISWERANVQFTGPIDAPIVRAHNKTGKPFGTFTDLVELHYPHSVLVDEWSYFSQLNQRDAMRFAIEHYRFSGRCRGALLWQLNDCWPVESWSVLEFDGHKKAAAYELPRLFAPLLLRIVEEDGDVVVSACLHNSQEAVSGELKVIAQDLDSGEQVFGSSFGCSVELEEIKELWRHKALRGKRLVWAASLGPASATLVSVEPQGIRHLSPVTEAATTIELASPVPVVDVRLEDWAMPNSFEPNFFTLLAGSRITVRSAEPIGQLQIQCLDFGPAPSQ